MDKKRSNLQELNPLLYLFYYIFGAKYTKEVEV
jgi:hypothetical protein